MKFLFYRFTIFTGSKLAKSIKNATYKNGLRKINENKNYGGYLDGAENHVNSPTFLKSMLERKEKSQKQLISKLRASANT